MAIHSAFAGTLLEVSRSSGWLALTLDKQGMVKELTDEIVALQQRGYTIEEVAESLRKRGLGITTPTLKNYLQRVKRAGTNGRKPRRPPGSPRTRAGTNGSAVSPTGTGASHFRIGFEGGDRERQGRSGAGRVDEKSGARGGGPADRQMSPRKGTFLPRYAKKSYAQKFSYLMALGKKVS